MTSATSASTIVWFELPARELTRAMAFYSGVLGIALQRHDFPGGGGLAVFPHGDNAVGGCIFQSPDETPADHGPLIYFSAQGRLDAALAQVEALGGRIVQAKHAIPPHGERALVLDSEGNRIALHSM